MDKDGTCKEVEKEQTRKRKTENLSSMFQRLEDIGKSMVEQMDRHQEKKMQRFDRFLDIFFSENMKCHNLFLNEITM